MSEVPRPEQENLPDEKIAIPDEPIIAAPGFSEKGEYVGLETIPSMEETTEIKDLGAETKRIEKIETPPVTKAERFPQRPPEVEEKYKIEYVEKRKREAENVEEEIRKTKEQFNEEFGKKEKESQPESADRNYYETLGISKDASFEEIKKAYFKLIKETHPDVGGNAKEFKRINEAFENLSKENKNKEEKLRKEAIERRIKNPDLVNKVLEPFLETISEEEKKGLLFDKRFPVKFRFLRDWPGGVELSDRDVAGLVANSFTAEQIRNIKWPLFTVWGLGEIKLSDGRELTEEQFDALVDSGLRKAAEDVEKEIEANWKKAKKEAGEKAVRDKINEVSKKREEENKEEKKEEEPEKEKLSPFELLKKQVFGLNNLFNKANNLHREIKKLNEESKGQKSQEVKDKEQKFSKLSSEIIKLASQMYGASLLEEAKRKTGFPFGVSKEKYIAQHLGDIERFYYEEKINDKSEKISDQDIKSCAEHLRKITGNQNISEKDILVLLARDYIVGDIKEASPIGGILTDKSLIFKGKGERMKLSDFNFLVEKCKKEDNDIIKEREEKTREILGQKWKEKQKEFRLYLTDAVMMVYKMKAEMYNVALQEMRAETERRKQELDETKRIKKVTIKKVTIKRKGRKKERVYRIERKKE